MSSMELNKAVEVCRTSLYRLDPTHPQAWQEGLACDRGFHNCYHGQRRSLLLTPHDIPMPPASWALAGAMLERLRAKCCTENASQTDLWAWDEVMQAIWIDDNPRDAILLAAAAYIEAQRKI